MKLQKYILIALLLIEYSNLYSQATSELVKPKPTTSFRGKNDIRLGYYPTRITFAYDRALSDKWSIGIEGIKHGGTFPGYSTGLSGRYYLKGFNHTGFFLEEKLSYSYYQTTAYDSITYAPTQVEPLNTYGEHTANLSYYANTFSSGYRLFWGNYFFIEFIAGLRLGILQKGIHDNDLYLNPYGLSLAYGSTNNIFYTWGPGFPICFNIRIGVRF